MNLPQVDDNQCAQCHIPQGRTGVRRFHHGRAHRADQSATAPGINFQITEGDNGGAGKTPTVTFTVKDNAGNGIPMASLTGGSNRLALVMAGPTTRLRLHQLRLGRHHPGLRLREPGPHGHLQPAMAPAPTPSPTRFRRNATGTYAIGIEGRRGLTMLPGTTQQTTTEYGGNNKVLYFSVDGSPVAPRRTVVAIANCNNCHTTPLAARRESQPDRDVRAVPQPERERFARCVQSATVPADKTQPPQGVNFALMIHKIHTGEKLGAAGLSYTIVGFGGSHNDFSDVRYPTMTPTGTTGDTAKCYMCHVNSSEAVFPIGKNTVADHARAAEPGAGHHLGLHGLPLQTVDLRARRIQHRSEVRRELRCLPRRRRRFRRRQGARRQ